MKPGRGKNKGNRFESLSARLLSKWLTGGKDGTQLIPSRLSGGWKDKDWRHAGDLAPNGPVGEKFRKQFVVECKHRKIDLLWALFTQVQGENIQGWWEILCVEARRTNALPMLICKQNSRPTLVGLPEELAWLIAEHLGGGVVSCSRNGVGLILFSILTTIQPAQLYTWIPTRRQKWREVL